MRFLVASLFAFLFAANASALPIDWKLYMRTPSGTNSRGGKQFSLVNPGSRGNEFRLGNETAYGEAYFNAHVLESKGPGTEFFDANVTFMYAPQMDSQYASDGARDTQVIQAFVKGGNFDGFKGAMWAGKRFYRDADLHMDDFFYFADMSGVGGGVEAIPMFSGQIAFAYLAYGGTPPPAPALQRTINGGPQKQALDVRWTDIKLSDKNILHTWLAAAYMPPGTGYAFDTTTSTFATPVDYEATSGLAAGARWRHLCTDKVYNDVTLMYGYGAMENFNLQNSPAYAANGTNLSRNKRTRFVDALVMQYDKWSMQAGFVYEAADLGAGATADRTRWISIGARPIYYFTDHYHLAFEAGHSIVKVDSEVGTGGAKAGDRTLTRFTLAPELALDKGYFARPVVRAYVTHTMWNGANNDTGNTGSLASSLKNAGVLSGRSETSIGFQGEVWF